MKTPILVEFTKTITSKYGTPRKPFLHLLGELFNKLYVECILCAGTIVLGIHRRKSMFPDLEKFIHWYKRAIVQ